MDAQQFLSEARDAISVKRVFGEPYERNGVAVIPVAKVAGGGGGGQGSAGADEQAEGMGAGFGMGGTPVGAYVVRGEDVSFEPAIDRNAIVLRAMGLLALALVLLLRRR